MLVGRQAFATTRLGSGGKKGFQLFVKPFGSAGTADPLNQMMSVGWKANFAVKYLGGNSTVSDPHRVIRLIGTSDGD